MCGTKTNSKPFKQVGILIYNDVSTIIDGVMYVMTNDFLMDADVYEDKDIFPDDMLEVEDELLAKKKVRIGKVHGAKEKRYIP